jgi:hypothetical protein
MAWYQNQLVWQILFALFFIGLGFWFSKKKFVIKEKDDFIDRFFKKFIPPIAWALLSWSFAAFLIYKAIVS